MLGFLSNRLLKSSRTLTTLRSTMNLKRGFIRETTLQTKRHVGHDTTCRNNFGFCGIRWYSLIMTIQSTEKQYTSFSYKLDWERCKTNHCEYNLYLQAFNVSRNVRRTTNWCNFHGLKLQTCRNISWLTRLCMFWAGWGQSRSKMSQPGGLRGINYCLIISFRRAEQVHEMSDEDGETLDIGSRSTNFLTTWRGFRILSRTWESPLILNLRLRQGDLQVMCWLIGLGVSWFQFLMNGWKRLMIFWSERLQGCRLRTSVVILEGFQEPILDVTFVFIYVWSWIEAFHATSSDFRFCTNTRLDQWRHMLRPLSMRLNWKWESEVFNVPSPEKPRKHDETWKSPMETIGNTSEWRWWISQPVMLVLFWGEGHTQSANQDANGVHFIAFPLARNYLQRTGTWLFVNTTKTNIFKLRIGGLGRCFSKPISGARRQFFGRVYQLYLVNPPPKEKTRNIIFIRFQASFFGELARIDSDLNQTSLAKSVFSRR